MAELLIPPFWEFADNDGNPLSGGLVYTYAAGTTTPKATFTDSGGLTANANPVVLDVAGRAVIWGAGSYKFVIKDSLGNTIKTVDNVTTYNTLANAVDPYFESFSGNGSQTVFTLSENVGSDSENVYVWVADGLEEHVTNGDFATDSDWTKGAGWTIAAGVATATGAISTALSQDSAVTLLEGQAYALEYTITRSAGGIIPSIGGYSGTERTATGTYREVIVCGSTQVLAFTGNAFTGTVDNVSITPAVAGKFEIQNPSSYTVSGTSLTFSSAPPTGTNNIYVSSPSLLLGAASNAAAAAEAAEAGALAAQTAAETAETNAETAETNAEAAQAAAEAAQAAAEASAEKLTGTSTTSLAIATGEKIFTTQADKFFEAGNWLLITSDADPTNFMHGQVTTYSGTTLTMNITNIGGSGTLDDWTIRLSGTRGAVGPTGPAGSVADGDKGDITVSGSGTIWTIDNDAVTLAKMSAGTAGNLITYDASGDPAAVATGTSGQVLTSNGAGAAPTFQDVETGGLIDVIYYTCPSQTVTISNASPAVLTYGVSGRNRPENGCPVRLTTTGTLPTGLDTGITYWIINSSGTTSNISATKGGAAINTSSAGTGTHTIVNAPYEKTVSNPSFVEVDAVGGTGGSGSSVSQVGGGGGGGARKIIQNADLLSSETVTTGVAGAVNGAGGTTSFGSHLSATGGSGGDSLLPSSGGAGTGGDLNIIGGLGHHTDGNTAANYSVGGISAFGYSRGGSNSVGQVGIVIVREYA